MKRNMELIKKILVNVENDESEALIDGYDKQEVLDHKAYLVDERYLDGLPHKNTENRLPIVDRVIIFKLTKKGHDFIMNNGKEEYSKIEKTEINNNINIHGNNHGIASVGNENIIINSEFNQKFSQLTQAIQVSNIKNKNQIIKDLNEYKEDKVALQEYLGKLLTRGAEVVTLLPLIGSLLGLV